MAELDKLKVIIRSMLISEPTQQMSVREIARRHKQDEGRPIPYVNLGFDSLGNFLQSIPDIVHFSGYGDEAILRPVISREVSHIQAMIVRQKPPKSKVRRFKQPAAGGGYWSPNPRPYSNSPSQYSWNRPRQPPTFSNYGQTSITVGSRQPQPLRSLFEINLPYNVCPQEKKSDNSGTGLTQEKRSDNIGTGSPQTMPKKEAVFLPASIKQKLLQIVRENPGQSIQNFASSVGKGYPHISELYSNIVDLINDLETLNIVAGCVHLANEGAPVDTRVFEYKEVKSSSQVIPAGMENYSDDESLFHDIDDALDAKELSSSKHSAQYDPRAVKKQLADEGAAHQRLRQHNSAVWGNGERCMGDDIQKRLADLLCFYPTGIACSMLPDLFKKHNKFELDYRACGFPSIIAMLKSCPEQFVCIQEGGNWKVCNAKGYWTDAGSVPGHIKEQIMQLMANFTGGVHIDAFADLYQRMFSRRFDHQEYGFDSIDNLFFSINNSVVKTETDTNRFMIYPLDTNENQEGDKPDLVVEARASPEPSDSGILHLIPKDCICPDYEFPKLVMPEGIVPGSSLCLIIAAVSNLDNFYVHIRGKGYSESLDLLVDDMMDFYERHKKKYRIPPEAVLPGVICVTLTFGEYSRCIILSEKTADDVTVIPMDYGCTTTVKKKGLLFLHENFAKLPPQAIDCRCANLRPPFNELSFNRKAAIRFLELVKDKAIYAQVAQYDEQRNFISVSLIDTTGDEDIHINDVLCQESLASFRMDTLITDMPLVQQRPKWENPLALKEEPKPAPLKQMEESTELKWSQQTNEPKGLQKLDEPKWASHVNVMEPPQPLVCPPPPGFKPLPKMQVETNLARPRAPPDTRLFPDQYQLMAAYQIPQGEMVEDEILPSLSSLQEYYSAQDLAAVHAQQQFLTYADATLDSPEYPLDSDGPRTVQVEFSSVEQLKPMKTTKESSCTSQNASPDNTCQQKSLDSKWLRTDVPEFLPMKQHQPITVMEEPPAFSPLPLSGRQDFVDSPDTTVLPRTLQVEFSSPEQLRPMRPVLPPPFPQTWQRPPIHPVAPTDVLNLHGPFGNPNENRPPMPIMKTGPPFNYGLPPPPVVPFGAPFGNFPTNPPPPPFPRQMFDGHMHPPLVESTMPCPNFGWGGQQPVYFQRPRPEMVPPPKKVLEIRSPNPKAIPHAPKLPEKMQGHLATQTPATLSKDRLEGKPIESVGNKNTSKLSLQANGLLEEGSNLFSQSTSPLISDFADDVPIGHETSRISDGIDHESLENDDHETSQDLALETSDDGEVSDSNVEEDSLDELEDTTVIQRSSTPHSQPDEVVPSHLEVDAPKEAEHSSIPAEHVGTKPILEKTTIERSVTTTSKKRRFISTIDVAGKHLNVFWLDGHPFLEVELLLGIGKLRAPVALKIVKTKSINKKFYELKAKQNPEIFDEMANLGICHANHLISPNAKVLLVRLYDVSELLSSINVCDASYMKELHAQVYLHSIE